MMKHQNCWICLYKLRRTITKWRNTILFGCVFEWYWREIGGKLYFFNDTLKIEYIHNFCYTLSIQAVVIALDSYDSVCYNVFHIERFKKKNQMCWVITENGFIIMGQTILFSSIFPIFLIIFQITTTQYCRLHTNFPQQSLNHAKLKKNFNQFLKPAMRRLWDYSILQFNEN